jgi:hypothetical protein
MLKKLKFIGNKGYVLTEAIVASSIIVISIVGALSLLNSVLRQSSFLKQQFIASQLALEGIEIVRAIRDENWIASRPWNSGLLPGSYQAQYDSRSLSSFSGTPLKFDPATGLYQYNTGQDTEFVRKITISDISPDEIRVLSSVSWQVRGIPFAIDVESRLFNWFNF